MIARTKVESIIGKGYADKLDEVIFEVSPKLSYTRREMVEVIGCANFSAAGKLAKVLRKLGIHSPAQLFNLDPASLARTRGIGEACIFVAMCILDSNKYDVMEWWQYKRDNVVKFSSFKHHVISRARKHKQEVA